MAGKYFKFSCVILAMSVLLVGGIMFASIVSAQEVKSDECVFLVHGLGRTKNSMMIMKHHLEKEGYRVVSFSYDSRHMSVDSAVGKLDAAVSNELHKASPPSKINFVTHSLGGILTRKVFELEAHERLGRVVMLSPPNHGSELPDKMGWIGLYRYVTGPAGMELGTDADSYPSKLGAVNFELGVIIGDRSLNPLYSCFIPGEDDGKVSIESAKVDGMSDFLVMHTSHTWIMNRKSVRRQVVHFLRNGYFEKSE
jgi:predicted alpha/beta hydrolase family esterase